MSVEDWNVASRGFGAAIRRYYADHGGASDEAIRSTVDTNTKLVPKRGNNLVALMKALTDRDGLEGARVVEIGSGFGALAGYLAWSQKPAHYLGLDMREDYAVASRRAVGALELPEGTLEFGVADMRDLSSLADGSADVVILNNAFIYLTTRADMRRALEEIHRVCAPGGHVLLFHANRWVKKEPFTGSPWIHLFSPRIAPLVAKVTGWKHNHGRVRLVSPRSMRRLLRGAGFRDVQVGAFESGAVAVGPKAARFATFYGAAGRKPE